jgi:ABC-type multidrug transport system fused ATPase/permease subunit
LQDVFLFSGSLANNIRLGNAEISDEKIFGHRVKFMLMNSCKKSRTLMSRSSRNAAQGFRSDKNN